MGRLITDARSLVSRSLAIVPGHPWELAPPSLPDGWSEVEDCDHDCLAMASSGGPRGDLAWIDNDLGITSLNDEDNEVPFPPRVARWLRWKAERHG